MRSKTAAWFVCKIRYEQTQENGTQKKVTEQYVVEALTFTEAEKRIVEEMEPFFKGEFEILDISRAPFGEVFFMAIGDKVLANETEKMKRAMKEGGTAAMEQYEKKVDWNPDNADTRWYKVRIQVVTLDEKTEKERRTSFTYLVEGCSLESARQNTDRVFGQTLFDYVIAGVNETKVVEVFEYRKEEE